MHRPVKICIYVLLMSTLCLCVHSILLRVASVQTLQTGTSVVKTIRDAEILWQEMINARGGVLINGTRYLVELISINVAAPTPEETIQKTVDAIRAIANGTYGIIHATMTPFSSVFTEAHAIEAEKHKILSCSGGKFINYYYFINTIDARFVSKLFCEPKLLF